MMSERKQGFYWVRVNDFWEVAFFNSIDGSWEITGVGHDYDEDYIDVIGDRIPTPDEMEGWQVVPKEPDSNMQIKGGCAVRIDTTDINRLWTANSAYKAMLQAAPKPGDVWQPN